MQKTESDATYFRRRAKEEACLALAAEQPEVAVAHHGLSVRYSGRARSLFSQTESGDAASVEELLIKMC